VSPIDVISHIPVLCEDSQVPYCYVGSKQALGEAGLTKRPTSVVLIPADKKASSDYEKYYDECFAELKALDLPILA
jgi:H/ACA ribonucleoprotein complex subunit 2